VYAGEKAAGWVSFGGIIFLVFPNKGRETTHQKGRKMIECVRKRTKGRERARDE
jgi:hypothetical protein|tara:strand:+ start:375 stop:536 length:162 start_codon:yes stop_codon:yes gene_type:complete